MASPTIVEVSGGNSGANVTSSVVTLPDGSNVVGRLLVVKFAKDGEASPAWPDGWEPLYERAAQGLNGSARFRVIDGTEGFDGVEDTITLTHELEGSAWECYLVSGHGNSVNNPPTVGAVTSGSGSSPNPPSCSPGVAKDFLWLAFSAHDGNVSFASGPVSFTDLIEHRWAHADGVGVGSARRFLNATVLDPSAFALSAADGSVTNTIAIHPALNALEKARARVRMTPAEAAEVRDLSTKKGKGDWIAPHTRASHRADVLANPTNPPDESSRRLGCASDLNALIPLPPPVPVRRAYTLCGVSGLYVPPGFLVDAPPPLNPIADFVFSPANLVVDFTDQSIAMTGVIETWDWDWGDGAAHGTTQHPQHTYALAGTYTVTLTVSQTGGLTDAHARDVTVVEAGNIPPTAEFTVSQNGLGITCTDASTDADGTIASRAWTFGDGGSSTATNPSHTYAVAGTYTVRLVVTDNGGLTNARERVVVAPSPSVVVIPPEIDPTGTFDVSGPLQAHFDGHPDGTTHLGPAGARYKVNFGIVQFNRFGLTLDAVDPANPPTLFQDELRPYGFLEDGSSHPDNRNRQVLEYQRGGGHILRNWWLQGGHPIAGNSSPFIAELEAQHALIIAGVQGMLVEYVFLTEVAGDFVYLNQPQVGGGIRIANDSIIIRHITGRKCGRQAITPQGVTNCLIEDFDLEDINRSVFDFEPPGAQEMVNITIQNGRAANFGNHLVAAAGNHSAIMDNIIVQDVEVVGRLPVIMFRGFRTYANPGTPPNLRRSRIYLRRINAHSITALASNAVTIAEFSACDTVECTDITVAVPAGTVRPKVGVFFNESCGITYSGCTWGGAVNDHEVTTGYNIVEVNVATSDPPLALGAVSVPLDTALSGNIPNNTKINFPSGNWLRTKANHTAGLTALTVQPLTTLVDGADAGEYATPVTTLNGENLQWPGRPGFPGCA